MHVGEAGMHWGRTPMEPMEREPPGLRGALATCWCKICTSGTLELHSLQAAVSFYWDFPAAVPFCTARNQREAQRKFSNLSIRKLDRICYRKDRLIFLFSLSREVINSFYM